MTPQVMRSCLAARLTHISGALLLCAASSCASAPHTTVTTRDLAPGITYTQEITFGESPLIVNILRVNLAAPGVRIRTGQARDTVSYSGPDAGLEPVSGLVARTGAIAGVNADYFPYNGDPVSLEIRDGELLSEPIGYRACLGITGASARIAVLTHDARLTLADKSTLPLDGINRLAHDGESVVITPSYTATPVEDRPTTVISLTAVNLPVHVSTDVSGEVTDVSVVAAGQRLPPCPPGGALIVACGLPGDAVQPHVRQGDTVSFRFDLLPTGDIVARGRYASRAAPRRSPAPAPVWAEVDQAVGGGPWLVRDGQIAIDGVAQGLPLQTFVLQRHPRTAVGITSGGRLLLVTVDGRKSLSQGATLDEMAAIMKRLGAMQAMNLDGGGSTTMVVGGGVVNTPSDGRARPVADTLLVYGHQPNVEPSDWQISPLSGRAATVPAGQTAAFGLVDSSGRRVAAPVIWGTQEGSGFVSQSGQFTSFHAGRSTLVASVGGSVYSLAVDVLPGPAELLRAAFSNVANDPPDRHLLTVTVSDRYGDPVAGSRVTARIYGGEIDSELVTDARGQAAAEVIWSADPGKRAAVVSLSSRCIVILHK